MTDYATRIHWHLEQYCAEHYGKYPEVIFMSRKLLWEIYFSDIMYHNVSGELTYVFHGIPAKIYISDKLEYYFAESGCEFD